MRNGVMKEWLESSCLAGANATYVEELYEAYLSDPEQVDATWREMFEQLPQLSNNKGERAHSSVRELYRQLAQTPRLQTAPAGVADERQAKVMQLINAYRLRGHLQAKLDPLKLHPEPLIDGLTLEYHCLNQNDLNQEFHTGTFAGGGRVMLSSLIEALQRVYCGSIGAEYMHIATPEQKNWLQKRLESEAGLLRYSREQKIRFLQSLSAAEGLEKYLGGKFPGAKRFSLEGGDALIPMIRELVDQAGESGIKEVVIGMAHRGRLNALVNVVGKKPQDLFDEFAGKHRDESWGTGDVKYHQGFSSDIVTEGGTVHVALAFNPSHLEIANPVVMGSVRARQDRFHSYSHDGSQVLPITVHGDAAFPGQGVVSETFNLSETRAYGVGGTVRIVINNQVGFTTSNLEDARSTFYCTDIAKMVEAPIFHVNGDDLEAVLYVTRLALEFRNTFHKDVVIDLVCYRRHGHNEADEPNATQPLMYQSIKKHPTPRSVYAQQLASEGILSLDESTALANQYRDALSSEETVVQGKHEPQSDNSHWLPYLNQEWNVPYQSASDAKELKALAETMCKYPEDFPLQRQVAKIYDDRKLMAQGEKPLDWGFAETLAYASLLDAGYKVRITGQDVGRGTFFHRHAVLHNQRDASVHIPLCHLGKEQGRFEIYDSVLSEEAVLAFEYGYATAEPRGLNIWEAQFGDFANGAQVVIDQFLSSGEQKWGRMCGLTMLLPHGYEGQGPEHSSARLERYLQLCAQQNMQVCVPSSPAQVFHMLRRQILRPVRRPLIVLSPKSLLRHPLAVSSFEELCEGQFQNAIDEVDPLVSSQVKRVVFCAGKVYYDLLEQRRANQLQDVALVRIEQLYPFPHEELLEILGQYQHVSDFVWCQEEPQNQGAWYCSQHHIREVLPQGAKLRYAGRAASASSAEGYMSVHLKNQKALVESALNLDIQE